MERRFYLGVGLLAVVLVLGMITAWAIEKNQQPTAQLLEQAAESEDLEAGIQLARQAEREWRDHWKGVASVADHTPMDEIDGLFAELEVYARAGEQVHFAACCARLSRLLRAVSDAHRLSWWNVL